jgi:Holliday junction resolvase
MKEVKPGSERDVQRRIIVWLRKRGWLVINTSGSWRATRGMAGVPDLICIFKSAVVFLEVKGHDKQILRGSQEKFFDKIVEHLGETLYFNVINDEKFERIQWLFKEIENDRTV